MSQGKEYLLYISTTGLSTGVKTEVELQGDLTINTGKTINTQVYKNGQESAQNDAGFSCSLTMGNSAPLGAGEELIWSAHDSGAPTYFWIENARTGGLEFAFSGRVAIQSLGAPVSGASTVSVQIGAVGEVTRSTAA